MYNANILIVDDEALIAESIQSTLKREGYTIDIATTTEEGIKKAEENRPDLILMDIRFEKDMRGIEAGMHIMENLNIPIIFVTAFGDDDTYERAKRANPYDFILKPHQDKDLPRKIDICINKHRKINS